MKIFGPRVELTRYAVAEGERVLYGQRIDGAVHVFDLPADEETDGRVYLVEKGLQSNAELQALLSDYIAVSQRRGAPAILLAD